MNEITRLLDEVLFENQGGNYVPKHPKIKRTVFGLVTSLSRYGSFEEGELIGSSFSIAWEALRTFKLADGASWDEVIDGSDELNLNRAVLAVCKRLEHELPVIANPDTKRLYDPETGGKTLVKIDFDSTDRPLYDESGEIIGTVGDGATTSFFSPQGEAQPLPFLEWFRANRYEFLTARQNEFIDAITSMDFAKDSDYVEERDFAEIVGMQPRDLDRIKKRICERTLKAWGERPESKLSRRTFTLKERLESLREFIAIVESDENLTEQNAQLSEWIRKQEREYGEDITDRIYDVFAGDLKATRGFSAFLGGKVAVLESSLLYRVYDMILTEVERIESEIERDQSTEPMPLRSTEITPDILVRMEAHKEFKKTQPCRVYSEEGEVQRELQYEPKEYKVMSLNAYGIRHDLRDN
ncbi:hypothetical protein [Bacillus sp. JJ722]|uniref:hypothetical protein n=1 Tax=Bacillus sp. JJ722 TaxID=3122973 RepID=UPI00300063AA